MLEICSWAISLCTSLTENQEHFSFQQVQICSFAPLISRLLSRGVTGKFFWRGKATFPGMILAFSRTNFHFGRPKKSFNGFPKVNYICYNFSSFSSFPLPFFLLSFAIFHFFTFFSLPRFSQLFAKNFPVKVSVGHSAPLPPPSCYATAPQFKDAHHICHS